jgi:hypothetical protein
MDIKLNINVSFLDNTSLIWDVLQWIMSQTRNENFVNIDPVQGCFKTLNEMSVPSKQSSNI